MNRSVLTRFPCIHDRNRHIELLKLLTTPADPSLAVLDGIDQLAKTAGIPVSEVSDVRHATTIATNTIIQRNGPKTATPDDGGSSATSRSSAPATRRDLRHQRRPADSRGGAHAHVGK